MYLYLICFQMCCQITFKNMASRPYNIYPNGLTRISPLQRTSNGKLQSPLSINTKHHTVSRVNFLLLHRCRERLALHGYSPQRDVWVPLEANNRRRTPGGRPPVSDPAVPEHRLTREGLDIRAGGNTAHLQVRGHQQERSTGEEKELSLAQFSKRCNKWYTYICIFCIIWNWFPLMFFCSWPQIKSGL